MLRSRALVALVSLLFQSDILAARQPVHARRAMVVSADPLATSVGLDIIKAGGNAVDAAVAVGFALAVTYPVAGNIGGGGFMLVRLADGTTTFFDFRERAPGKATRNMYVDSSGELTQESIQGWKASGVPGTVRGLELAHKRFGKKRWADLVSPSARLAREGFPILYGMAESLNNPTQRLSGFQESKRIFLKNGARFQAGDKLVQSELAAVLERIARLGADDFYQGETARRLVAEMESNGGLITASDLRNYRAVERKPLHGTYKGYEIWSAPPPSSGGVGLLQMLGVLDGSGYEKTGLGSAQTIHWQVEAMRRFFADRNEYLADPDFVKVPVKALLHPNYIAQLRSSIDSQRATPSDRVRPGDLAGYESGETTHYSIVDAEGNAVAVTYTLNGSYGSGVTVPGLGFLLNNEMDDFSTKPGTPNKMFNLVQGEANAIAPGKRPLSAMTPTIVLRDGKLFMVYGGPGGPRIITAVLQVFLNVVDFGLNIQDAVDRPRFHHQWKPDKITIESNGFSPDTIKLLESRGHSIETSASVARIEAILIENGWLKGASDGRGYGKAEGF